MRLYAVTGLLGALVAVAPFVFDYNDEAFARRATGNDVIIGVGVVVYSLIQVGVAAVPSRRNDS